MIRVFRVELSDGKQKVTLYGTVVWLPGGDSKLKVVADVTEDVGQLLDEWEANGTKVQYRVVPERCSDFMASQFVDRPCSEREIDYNSQDGQATIEWTYNPAGPSTIIINTVSQQAQ